MKLTRSVLRDIIKEEIQRIDETDLVIFGGSRYEKNISVKKVGDGYILSQDKGNVYITKPQLKKFIDNIKTL